MLFGKVLQSTGTHFAVLAVDLFVKADDEEKKRDDEFMCNEQARTNEKNKGSILLSCMVGR